MQKDIRYTTICAKEKKCSCVIAVVALNMSGKIIKKLETLVEGNWMVAEGVLM